MARVVVRSERGDSRQLGKRAGRRGGQLLRPVGPGEEITADYGPHYGYQAHGFRRNGATNVSVAWANQSFNITYGCGFGFMAIQLPMSIVLNTGEANVYECARSLILQRLSTSMNKVRRRASANRAAAHDGRDSQS